MLEYSYWFLSFGVVPEPAVLISCTIFDVQVLSLNEKLKNAESLKGDDLARCVYPHMSS